MATSSALPSSAAVVGQPRQIRMLRALIGGLSRPASELARAAGQSTQATRAQLLRLRDSGWLRIQRTARHEYFALASREVDELVRHLPGADLPSDRISVVRFSPEVRAGRTCWGHLAGDLGLRVTDLLVSTLLLEPLEVGVPTARPSRWPAHPIVAALALDAMPESQRAFAVGCLDVTGRRPHAGGALGTYVLAQLRRKGWVTTEPGRRLAQLTPEGESALTELAAA